jgi:hypothetical protein
MTIPTSGHPAGTSKLTTAAATQTEPGTVPEPQPARRREAARAFRPSRTLPAVAVAAALAAAAIAATVQVVAGLIHRTVHLLPVAWLTRLGHDTHWSDPAAQGAAALVFLLGILLIAAAFAPGRSRAIPLTPPDPHTVIGITCAGLRRQLAAAATGIDGIARAHVRVGRRSIRVKALSPLRDTTGLSQQVHQALTGRLQHLAPLRPLRVRVTVRRRKD